MAFSIRIKGRWLAPAHGDVAVFNPPEFEFTDDPAKAVRLSPGDDPIPMRSASRWREFLGIWYPAKMRDDPDNGWWVGPIPGEDPEAGKAQ